MLRLTAAFVLAIIAWGSTVELTHVHTNAAVGLNTQTTPDRVLASPDNSTSPSVRQNETPKSSSRSYGASECLICQLQHNLTTTLLAQPAATEAPNQQADRALAHTSLHLLEFTTAQSGRAPPII